MMRAALLIGLAMLGSVGTGHAANVQDQVDCARVAQKGFDDAMASGSRTVAETLSNFESHYNTKMHACLVVLNSVFTDGSTGQTLMDGIGNHIFANYISPHGNAKMPLCYFEPAPYAGYKSCDSLDEFMAGIKPYMTE